MVKILFSNIWSSCFLLQQLALDVVCCIFGNDPDSSNCFEFQTRPKNQVLIKLLVETGPPKIYFIGNFTLI